MNKYKYHHSIRFILVCSLVAMSLAQDGHTPGHVENEYWSALNNSMEKMHHAMASVKPSGKSDMDFVALMLPHHQAAVEMAKAELLYGKDSQMRRLAQEIITDQQSEIQLMQLWLKQHPDGHQ